MPISLAVDQEKKVETQRRHACIMQVLDAAAPHEDVQAASSNDDSNLPGQILIANTESVYSSNHKILN